LSLFGLWTPTSALAQSCTTTVSDTADSGANTLRGKIAAAVAGSVICLPSATITLATPVLLDKSLTISGTGASGSIVSGGNATRVLSVTAGVNVVLQGLTVRDGFLENGDFFGNEPGHGAGIYNAGTLTVRSSQVISNGLINTLSSSNYYDGAGIYNIGVLTLTNSTVLSNQMTTGQGAGLYNNGRLVVNGGTQIVGNIARIDGGGIYNDAAGSVLLDSAEVSRNQASTDDGSIGEGGGIYNKGWLTITNGSRVDHNYAPTRGGGVHNVGGQVVVQNSSIFENSSYKQDIGNLEGKGAGLYNSVAGSRLVLDNSAVYSNTVGGGASGGFGAGIFNALSAELVVINGSRIYWNGQLNPGSAVAGGGIFDEGGLLTIDDSFIVSNTLDYAGQGGGIFLSGVLTMTNSLVEGNSGGEGGGLVLGQLGEGIENGGGGYVGNSILRNNTAQFSGGGIYNAGQLTIADNSFLHHNVGGGIYNQNATLTVQDSELYSNTRGSAIRANRSTITVTNSLLHHNEGNDGNAIYLRYSPSSLYLSNSQLYENVNNNANNGGALYLHGPGLTAVITGSQIYSNAQMDSGSYGGGIYIESAQVEVSNSAIYNNYVSSYDGGGIYFYETLFDGSSWLKVSNSQIYNNMTGPYGDGGGGLYAYGVFTLTQSTIYSNTTFGSGGGLYAYGPATIVDSKVYSNYASSRGGGIYFKNCCGYESYGIATLQNSEVYSNYADGYGGGITNDRHHLLIVDSDIHHNSSTNNGGGVYEPGRGVITVTAQSKIYENHSNHGGGFYSYNILSIVESEVFSNTARAGDGGGIYIEGDTLVITGSLLYSNTASGGNGGALYNNTNTTQIANSTWYTNSASTSGGAVYLSSGDMTVISSTYSMNTAAVNGGAFYGRSPVLVVGSRFDNNHTDNDGGAFYIEDGRLEMVDSDLYDNTSINGGAIYHSNATTQIDTSRFYTNTASGRGGALYHHSGEMAIRSSSYSMNAATSGEGGAIYNQDALSMTTSTLDGNQAGTSGGGIANGASGVLTATNVTLHANQAGTTGGGIDSAGGKIDAVNVTLSANEAATNAGGIHIGGGTVALTNTIVANSLTSGNAGGDLVGSPAISTSNWIGTLDLENLQNNGGPTWTMALPEGSPAIDSGSNVGCPATDQRGLQRPVGTACDIGAYERSTLYDSVDLTSLRISDGTLTPSFVQSTTVYTVAVPNSVHTLVVTSTTSSPNATIDVNGTGAISGTGFGPIALLVGPNPITVTVTAANGGTTRTYVVIVTRAPSSNADLGNLSAATGGGANIPLNPAPFNGATVSYSGTVAHEVVSGTVTATAADTTATIVVNGSAVASGSPAGPFALNVGANVFTVTVTAQDGTTVKSYTVTIVRAPSGNADLGNLSAATGGGANIPLNPAPFNGATVSYSGTVAHEVVSGTVTATAADTAATIVVNGSAVASGSPAGPFVLNVGANVFTVTVTAQDGTTVKSYTVTIVRAPLTGIAGVVYNDVNGNARLDGGEVGLAGVAVALQQNGVVVATTATHSQGEYLFANVVPGASIVQITLPVGFGASFLEQVVNAVTGVLIESANFGLTENGSIAGVVFVDQDTNHLQGTGELGVAGVSIELLEGGSVRQSQTTDVNGIYRFTGVPVGSYRLRLALPVGYVSTVGNEAEITLSSGFTAKSNFSVQLQGSLSGLLYEDRNGNQRPDASEPGVGGVSVTLFQNGGVVQSVNTGAEGYYQFLGLAAGLYTVQASVPDALVANGVVEVAVNLDGIGAAAVNFGYQSRGVVSGIVYQDLNNNQQQDMTEPGLEGVRLEAVQGGNVLGAVVSQTDGSYRIAGLPPGTYLLRLVLPAGFAPVTPQEEEIFLTGGNGQNVGFGLLPVSTIAGMVFEDLNGDGVRQFFEPGMGNVRLAIYGAGVDTLFRTFDDVYVREVRSAGDGSYQFLNQAIDSYDVVVDGLASYTHSTPSQVAVNLGQFWTAAASFGFQRTNRVAATTYEDFDGNGRQGMDEPPLANLPVVLVNQSAGVMGSGLLGAQTTYSATTSSVGFVSFRDVLAGDYEVRTVPPSNSYVAPRTLANFSIAPDGTASEQFGFFQIGTVSGSVFNDVDGNGKRAEVEAGMAGLIVEILNVDDSVRATRVTATDGKFRFTALPAGSYRVRVAGPSGYASTSLNPAAFTLTDAGIGAAAFVDLGFATTDSITGRVFSDINKNRSQDAGEIGVAGTTVTLRRAGQTDRTAKTAVDGSFLFSATAAGDFQLEVTLPPDFIPTTALVADGTLAVDRAGAVTFGIRPNLPNLAPVLQPIADQSAAEGSAISLQSVATDQDDTVLVYAATGLPAGLTIDSGSGLISGVLGTGSAGSYAVEVRVSDPATAESRTSFTFIVVSPTALEPEVEPQIDNRIYLPAVQR
jgi:hypothetical protein